MHVVCLRVEECSTCSTQRMSNDERREKQVLTLVLDVAAVIISRGMHKL